MKDRAAVSLGRRGGAKGGYARAAALTRERRREIAVIGGLARWGKAPPPPQTTIRDSKFTRRELEVAARIAPKLTENPILAAALTFIAAHVERCNTLLKSGASTPSPEG
jgi:hypothetical protein